jgi:hypothetical protein
MLLLNRYPYPLIGLLSSLQKVYLGLSSAALMTGSTMLLKWVYRQINRPGEPFASVSNRAKAE